MKRSPDAEPGSAHSKISSPWSRRLPRAWFVTLLVLHGALNSFGQSTAQPAPAMNLDALRVRAEQGDPRAQVDLGLRLLGGPGVRPDYSQAAEWFKKAALQGDAQGQLELGVMYVNGEGMAADLGEAYAWYLLASQQGNLQAKEYLNEINRSLSGSDRAKATARAAELGKTIRARSEQKPRHGAHRQAVPASRPGSAAAEPASDPPGSAPPDVRGGTLPPESSAISPWRGLVIDGERFTLRQLIDRQQGGIPVGVFVAPETWRDQSQVVWNYAHHSNPVQLSASVENPANEEAVYSFPAQSYFCLKPDWGFYQPGLNLGGYIYTRQPIPAPQALLMLVQQVRGGQPKFQVIGSKDLPELPAALRLPSSPNQRGVGIKVTYEWNGKPVEEEFYAVYYSLEIPYDGPQGRTWQINWGLMSLHSFRAPAGTLDKRRAIFAAVAKSFRPNPEWQQRLAAINQYLQQEFNRQLQAGYDQIAAAAALSRQISANNDAMIASIDRQLAASRAASGSTRGGRSANDRFSDYIRGVETVDDPYYGTSQHSSNQQYHWTDGYGSYRHSNDPTYNPSQREAGNWQLMQPVP